MAKYYTRGKINNFFLPATLHSSWNEDFLKSTSLFDMNIFTSKKLGLVSGYTKVIIVRGIGYRTFFIRNDAVDAGKILDKKFTNFLRPVYSFLDIPNSIASLTQITNLEFPNSKYLIVRAGHTTDLYMPLGTGVYAQNYKKDRKLVVSSTNSVVTSNIAKKVWLYRPPSVYTGRGVRQKHVKPIRKTGKKDKQKGRAF